MSLTDIQIVDTGVQDPAITTFPRLRGLLAHHRGGGLIRDG